MRLMLFLVCLSAVVAVDEGPWSYLGIDAEAHAEVNHDMGESAELSASESKRLDDQIQNTHVKPLEHKMKALKQKITQEKKLHKKGDDKKLANLNRQVKSKAAQVAALQSEAAAEAARHFAGLKGKEANAAVQHTADLKHDVEHMTKDHSELEGMENEVAVLKARVNGGR